MNFSVTHKNFDADYISPLVSEGLLSTVILLWTNAVRQGFPKDEDTEDRMKYGLLLIHYIFAKTNKGQIQR